MSFAIFRKSNEQKKQSRTNNLHVFLPYKVQCVCACVRTHMCTHICEYIFEHTEIFQCLAGGIHFIRLHETDINAFLFPLPVP